MRYLKAALVGLVGGALLMAAVLALEIAHAERSASAQIRDCKTYVFSDRTEITCASAMQLGPAELPVAFAVGFAISFAWFQRGRRRLA